MECCMGGELLAKLIERESQLIERCDKAELQVALLTFEVRASRKLLKDKWFLESNQEDLKKWLNAMKRVDDNGVLNNE